MTSTPITQAVERLTDWLDGKSKPGTPDGHLHLADLRALLASHERMAKAAARVLHWRHPHEDVLTVTDGSREAIRDLAAILGAL